MEKDLGDLGLAGARLSLAHPGPVFTSLPGDFLDRASRWAKNSLYFWTLQAAEGILGPYWLIL